MPVVFGTGCLGTAELGELTVAIAAMAPAVDDVDRIERLRHFEQLKAAIAAAQLLEAADFDSSQRVEQAGAGEPSSRQGRGIDSQVALALRTSPWHARRWLGWATVLTRELPVTFEALRRGQTTEWRALLVARETIWLSRADRAEVDALLGPQLEHLSDARVEAEAKGHAARLDPAGVAHRRRVALGQRRVTVRPRPDTMSALSCVASVEQGVAAWAALRREADAVLGRGDGEGRTRDQIMADTCIQRLTGQRSADGVAIEVELIITSDTLFSTDTDDEDAFDGDLSANDTDLIEADLDTKAEDAHGPSDTEFSDTELSDTELSDTESSDTGRGEDGGRINSGGDEGGDEPALLTAEGITPIPIPARLARELIAGASQAWLRRLFTAPHTGELITLDSRRRLFTAGQRRLIRYRDQYCSTPWCGAPIRHLDHAHPHHRGGTTTTRNGNGKCAACNHTKQAPGWTQTPGTTRTPGTITTPTEHRYRLDTPRPPGHRSAADPLVDYAWNLIRAA